MTVLATSGKKLDDVPVTIRGDDIFIGDHKLKSGTHSIIDNFLIWSSNIRAILIYLECVCKVFQKYRASLRLDKCDFLKKRVEFGYDLLADGNCPAASKFNMINDWILPATEQSLHSVVGLVIFYNKYAPYLEMHIKPLRKLLKTYFRKNISVMPWSPSLVELFRDIKISITSSPVLARCDPGKPIFLKTDWSSEGMGYILIQPGNDKEFAETTTLLLKTGERIFDNTKSGARL